MGETDRGEEEQKGWGCSREPQSYMARGQGMPLMVEWGNGQVVGREEGE